MSVHTIDAELTIKFRLSGMPDDEREVAYPTVRIMLIRFSPMTTNCRVFPIAAVKVGIGRAFAVGADAEQRAEGVERVEAPVKAEGKFVEVGLQMLGLDAPVMRPLQPSFQV